MQTRYMERTNSMRGKRSLEGGGGDDDDKPERKRPALARVGLLAFHKALTDHPRHPLVVAAFSIVVHCGGSLSEAVTIARRISGPHDASFNELLEPVSIGSDAKLIDEILDLAASAKEALRTMIDEHSVSQAMMAYPQAP